MKLIAVVISIALTVPAVWGQKYPKRPAAGSVGPVKLTLKAKSLTAHRRTKSPRAAAPTPAPLVVQVFTDPASGSLTAYAVATSTIPSGTNITGTMTLLDDNSAINFQQVPLQNDLNPGDYLQLPVITNFGDLWNPGAFDYTVQVIPARGAATQADGVFLVGETLAFADLPNFQPLVSSATASINSSKDVILTLPGYYSGDPVQVVLADLSAFYIVPASAITVSPTQVTVDLSQVIGFDLTSLDNLLVTVDEDGYDDTIAFRYVPFQPGSYNPAPTQ
jgi:hypothetical protein